MLTIVWVLIGPFLALELGSAAVRVGGAARLRELAPRPARRLPARIRDPLTHALHEADVTLLPEDAVRLAVATAAAVFVVGLALAPALGMLGLLAVVIGAPLGLRMAASRRTGRMIDGLPSVLDQVAAELRGGGTVAGALGHLAEGDGPLAPDLGTVRARMALGADLGGALEAWAAERPHSGFAEVAGALTVAATTGGRAAAAITGLAASLRDRLAAVAEAGALSAQARVSAIVIGLAPIAYLVFSAAVDPRSATALVGTSLGRVCLALGIGLDALAAVWMRRLLRVGP